MTEDSIREDMSGAGGQNFWGCLDLRCLMNEVVYDVETDTFETTSSSTKKLKSLVKLLWITPIVHMGGCSSVSCVRPGAACDLTMNMYHVSCLAPSIKALDDSSGTYARCASKLFLRY